MTTDLPLPDLPAAWAGAGWCVECKQSPCARTGDCDDTQEPEDRTMAKKPSFHDDPSNMFVVHGHSYDIETLRHVADTDGWGALKGPVRIRSGARRAAVAWLLRAEEAQSAAAGTPAQPCETCRLPFHPAGPCDDACASCRLDKWDHVSPP